MISAEDMWFIRTRKSPDHNWMIRMQSINEEYLKTRGYDWKRLGFIDEFEVYQKKDKK